MKAGWEVKPLLEVSTKITQGPNPKYDGIEDDRFRVLKTKHLYDLAIKYDEADRISERLFVEHLKAELQDGDILLAIVGQGSINKCNVFQSSDEARYIFTRALGLIRPEQESVEPYYVKYFLQSDVGKGMVDSGIGGSSGQQVVTTTHLKKLLIPIPPLEEQKQIVAVLDAAFEGLNRAKENAEANLQNARELFESTLSFLFNQSEEWEATALNDHVAFMDYRGKTPPKREAGVRLITAKNVKRGFIQEEPMEFIDADAYEGWMTRGFPEDGDVLFTTEAPLANVAQLDTSENVVIGQRLITMKPDRTLIDREFLKFALMSPQMQEEIFSYATGATVLGIKAKLLKTVSFRFPKNLADQRKVAVLCRTSFEKMDQLAEVYRAKLADIADLRQSLLQKAFAGELT